MQELVYPERMRCRGCRRYFGFEVLFGKFCSRECAGLPDAPADVEEWPRCCRSFNPRDQKWRPKVPYFTEDSVRRAALANSQTWYPCPFCGTWHTASARFRRRHP